MSVMICWSPINDAVVNTGSLSHGTVHEKLQKVFGDFPLTLTSDDIQTLIVMSQVELDSTPYDDLIDAITAHDTIRVSAHF